MLPAARRFSFSSTKQEEEGEGQGEEGNEAEDLAGQFRQCYQKSKHDQGGAVSNNMNRWGLHQIARDLKMPAEDVIMLKSLFDDVDANENGYLDLAEFKQAVAKLLMYMLHDEALAVDRAKSLASWGWWDADFDASGNISFRDFLKWYCSNGFEWSLLLSDSEQYQRRVAKKHKITSEAFDSFKRCYDEYATDKFSNVDFEQFKGILQKLFEVPAQTELPLSRVHYFWSQLKQERSGTISFEEFLKWWWLTYFEPSGSQQKPFEDVYKQVRRVGMTRSHMDTPVQN